MRPPRNTEFHDISGEGNTDSGLRDVRMFGPRPGPPPHPVPASSASSARPSCASASAPPSLGPAVAGRAGNLATPDFPPPSSGTLSESRGGGGPLRQRQRHPLSRTSRRPPLLGWGTGSAGDGAVEVSDGSADFSPLPPQGRRRGGSYLHEDRRLRTRAAACASTARAAPRVVGSGAPPRATLLSAPSSCDVGPDAAAASSAAAPSALGCDGPPSDACSRLRSRSPAGGAARVPPAPLVSTVRPGVAPSAAMRPSASAAARARSAAFALAAAVRPLSARGPAATPVGSESPDFAAFGFESLDSP